MREVEVSTETSLTPRAIAVYSQIAISLYGHLTRKVELEILFDIKEVHVCAKTNLKQGAHIHQPTALPVPHTSAQPYHSGSGSHGQLFRPYWVIKVVFVVSNYFVVCLFHTEALIVLLSLPILLQL